MHVTIELRDGPGGGIASLDVRGGNIISEDLCKTSCVLAFCGGELKVFI